MLSRAKNKRNAVENAVGLCFYRLQNENDKKLSYSWETVRRESMPRIAEMDVEMTT